MGILNTEQEDQIHQMRVSYGQKVNLIRESLANKVSNLYEEQKRGQGSLREQQ